MKHRGDSEFIYLIWCETGHYKIGRAQTVKSRFAAIRTSCPFRVELIHSFETYDSIIVEKTLHRIFAAKRVSGEWFSLLDADIEWFKRIAAWWGNGPGLNSTPEEGMVAEADYLDWLYDLDSPLWGPL